VIGVVQGVTVKKLLHGPRLNVRYSASKQSVALKSQGDAQVTGYVVWNRFCYLSIPIHKKTYELINSAYALEAFW